MTFRKWAVDYCYKRGMFEAQAEAVVAQIIADPDDTMRGRWDDAIEGYPPQMLAVLSIVINHAACKWIDENMPKAWYRAMFDVAQTAALMGTPPDS